MGLLVIKEWKASKKPVNDQNNYIKLLAGKRGFCMGFIQANH